MQPPYPHRQNQKLFKAKKPSEVVPFISYASLEASNIHHHVKCQGLPRYVSFLLFCSNLSNLYITMFAKTSSLAGWRRKTNIFFFQKFKTRVTRA